MEMRTQFLSLTINLESVFIRDKQYCGNSLNKNVARAVENELKV